jgi:hypothetical protein
MGGKGNVQEPVGGPKVFLFPRRAASPGSGAPSIDQSTVSTTPTSDDSFFAAAGNPGATRTFGRVNAQNQCDETRRCSRGALSTPSESA